MPIQVIKNQSLKAFNTFGVNEIADSFVEVSNVEELKQALDLGFDHRLILGGGSNVLFAKRFEGLVIRNRILGIRKLEHAENQVVVEVGAGENWHEFVRWCLSSGFGGLENLSLIPGTVGAAPIQNIGAYGVEQDQLFISLEALDLQSGELKTFEKTDCQFDYRHSVFKGTLKGRYCITLVRYRLTTKGHKLNLSYGAVSETLERAGIGDPTIEEVSDAVISIRQSKLPDPAQIGNAGSFFKNPIVPNDLYDQLQRNYSSIPGYKISEDNVKIPAGWLIETCGWKGYRSNGVGIYERHALVLVNHGGGSGSELRALAEKIIESVKGRFGITLIPEVNII